LTPPPGQRSVSPIVALIFRSLGRNLLQGAAAAFLPLAAGGVPAAGQPIETVRLQLKWHHQFQFAGYYAAAEQGYYREAGLNVEILEESGTWAADEVASGRAEYGVEGPELLRQRAQGKPLVVLAAIFQHSAEALAVREDADVTSPQQLVGDVVALPSGGMASIRAMLAREGVKESQLRIREPSAGLEDLINGTVEERAVYLTDAPYILRQRGVRHRLLRPLNYGIDFYGDCLFTSVAEIEGHPERVRAFREASLRGWRYAMSHVEEMVNLIQTRYRSELSREALLYEADAMEDLILPNLVDIGHLNPGRWRHIADLYAELGMIKKDLPLEGFVYDPTAPVESVWVSRVARLTGAVALTGLLGAGTLALFNARLRRVVRSKTSQLHALNQQLRAVFDNSVELLGLLKPDGTLIEANRTALNLIGARLEDVAGKPFWETPWWSHSEATMILVREAIKDASEGRISSREAVHPGVDGRDHQIEFTITPIKDESGEVILLVPEGRDVTERKRAEDALRSLVAGTSTATGEEFFRVLVRHLADAFGSRYALVGQVTEDQRSLRTLAIWDGSHIAENREYPLADTPCRNVLNESICVYPKSIQDLFPEDDLLRQMSAQSYCGAPLRASSGKALGILAVLHDRELVEPDERARALLTVFAARAATELERLRYDNALRASEDKFSSAFHASPLAIVMTSIEQSRLIEVNQAFENLMGYPREELLGKSAVDLGLWANPIDRDRWASQMSAKGRVRNMEFEFHSRSGKTGRVLLSADTIDVAGETCALAVLADVTEQRRLEGYQASQFAITRRLSERPDIAVAGPELLQVICEDMAWEGGELSLKEASGGLLRAAVWARRGEAPESPGGLADHVVENGPVWVRDLASSSFQARPGMVGACGVPLPVGGLTAGALLLWSHRARQTESDQLLILQDVASQIGSLIERQRLDEGRARLQASLTQAAAEWRRTFDAIDAPTLITDAKGRIRRLNRAVVELTGRGHAELLGLEVGSLAEQEPWKTAARLIESVLAGEELRELQAEGPKGRRWDVFVTVAKATEGLEERVIVSMRDISAVVALQESLRRTERMSAMGSLVTGVAHEVRNPLFSISATLDMLHTELRDHASFAESWPILQAQVGRLTRLMRDLLDYAKPVTIRRNPTDVREVLRRAVRSCSTLAAGAEVTVVEDFRDDLPSLAVDAGRLEQVFENLLSNGIQHSPRGSSIGVAAHVVSNAGSPEVHCAFQDEGPGVSPADLPRLFEPFFTRRKGGTGLGLSISQTIVEDHGGRLWAEARPGGGSIFTVALPVPLTADNRGETSG